MLTTNDDTNPVDFTVLSAIIPDARLHPTILERLQAHVHREYALLENLWRNNDCQGLTQTAHKMKGACRMAGALRIASQCDHLQQLAESRNLHHSPEGLAPLLHTIQELDIFLKDMRMHAVNASLLNTGTPHAS